jgi:hypothetical protein
LSAKEEEVPAKLLRNLVHVVTAIPRRDGGYAWGQAKCRTRTLFANYHAFKAAVKEIRGGQILDTVPQSADAYIVSCPLPLYNPEERRSYTALTCKACNRAFAPQWWKQYTEADFLAHFWKCAHAQKLWKKTNDGRDYDDEISTETWLVKYFGRLRTWDGQKWR